MSNSRVMSSVGRTVVVVGTTFGAALLGAGAANADGPVQLRSRLAGNWCVDAPGGSYTAAVVNPCEAVASQVWTFNSAGQIENAGFPGECLSVSEAMRDSPVILWHCKSNTENERWTHAPNGQITSALTACLNISGGVAQPGTQLIAYQCLSNVEDEQWDAVPAAVPSPTSTTPSSASATPSSASAPPSSASTSTPPS